MKLHLSMKFLPCFGVKGRRLKTLLAAFYMNRRKNGLRLTDDPALNEEILALVAKWRCPEFSDDFAEMIASLHKLSQQNPTSSDMVLFKRSMAELRYAQRIFAPYRNIKKICVFGSARIRPPAPVYAARPSSPA